MLCRRYTPLKSQNVLKPTRYHCPVMPRAVLPCPSKCSAEPAHGLWDPLWAPKFTQSRSCARSVRKGACESAPKRKKADLWGPEGAKRCKNGAKMEENGHPKCAKNRGFAKKCEMWFGPIIYNIFSLLAPSKNLTFCYLRATKMHIFFAGCLGCRPGAAKWRSRGRKMARVGSPVIPKAAKGSPNAS